MKRKSKPGVKEKAFSETYGNPYRHKPKLSGIAGGDREDQLDRDYYGKKPRKAPELFDDSKGMLDIKRML